MLLMGKSTISMAIFNSYVKLPEGIWCYIDWHYFDGAMGWCLGWQSFHFQYVIVGYTMYYNVIYNYIYIYIGYTMY